MARNTPAGGGGPPIGLVKRSLLLVVLLLSLTTWLAAAARPHRLVRRRMSHAASRRLLAQSNSTTNSTTNSTSHTNTTTRIITELVVLGDSYSDTGRLFDMTNGTEPDPQWYWQGHYSNGPTWPDYLHALANNRSYATNNMSYPARSTLNVTLSGFNYTPPTARGKKLKVLSLALGGSPACQANRDVAKPGEVVVPWLDIQVDDFQAIRNGTYKKIRVGRAPASQRAVVVEIGANDYLNQLQNITATGDFNLEFPELFDEVVGCIAAGARRLLDMGEQNLIFFTLPTVDKLPQAQLLDIEKLTEFLADQAKKHNDRLRQAVANLRVAYPAAHILLYELGNATHKILDNPGQYNITETKDSCLQYETAAGSALGDIPLAGAFADKLFGTKIVGRCTDPNHVWFDRVHPTTTVHRLFAEDVAALLQQAGLR